MASTITATEIFENFGMTFKGVPTAIKEALLNDVDLQIVRAFGNRKKTINVRFADGAGLAVLAYGALFIESARWVDRPASTPGDLGGWLLVETSTDEEDTSGWDWRAHPPGTPAKFMQTHSLTDGQVQIDPPTDKATLILTAATNASPIVCTSSDVHGLSDSQRVDVREGLVNTNANGDHYAKVTGYSTTTFALYSDAALTVPVAGNGAYTASSGFISCPNSPYLQLFVRWHETLDDQSNMPEAPFYRRLYSNGMKFLYATDVDDDAKIAKYKALFEDVIAEQLKLTQQRSGRKPARMRVITQRPVGHVTRSRW